MPETSLYDYAIIRVLPRVEREEFINVGVIVSCPDHDFLGCAIHLDEERLRNLSRQADLPTIRAHLEALELICAGDARSGPIGQLPKRNRFHWLVAPRSTMIQTSPVHTGQCTDPSHVVEHLIRTMVSPLD